MRSPRKRPVSLSSKNVYTIPKGAKIKYSRFGDCITLKNPVRAIFGYKGYITKYAYFRRLGTKYKHFIVPYWNRYVKFYRHKLDNE